MSVDYENNPSVKNLQNYIRIRTVHPNVNYDECITYLRAQATEMGLSVEVVEPLPKKPVLVMTWVGLEPTLPSILLNSHMDVVPVFENSWTYPPFAAEIADGVLYGRGVQDMKSVGIQYLEAVKRLKSKGIKLKRTLHISFVPDEEVGGRTGMAQFVKTDNFKKLNVGFALDEGLASPNNEYLVYNGERTVWHMNVICPGKSGHGSFLLENTSGEKLRYMIDKLMDLRRESQKQLAENPNFTLGDVTSVNMTMLSGGIQENVVPEVLTATFDIRVALTVDQTEFERTIQNWCTEAGEGVRVEFSQRDPYTPCTKVDDSNAFWLAFKNAADQLKISLKCCIFPGGTDSRYLRELDIPAIGFSPMYCTIPGLHEHDERLGVDIFLKGIDIFEAIIPSVANV